MHSSLLSSIECGTGSVFEKNGMVVRWALILAGGLLLLGVAGISTLTTPGPSLAWCDLLGAWAAYFIAADIAPTSTRAQRIGGPVALSLGLFVACFVTNGGDTASWLFWSTLVFAFAFLVLGIFRWVIKEIVPKD